MIATEELFEHRPFHYGTALAIMLYELVHLQVLVCFKPILTTDTVLLSTHTHLFNLSEARS